MPFKPVNRYIRCSFGPVVSDSDFKTLLDALAYNASGLKLTAYREISDGSIDETDITVANGINADYGWQNLTNGMYSVRLPDSSGAGFKNVSTGVMYITGSVNGGLPFRSAVYDALIAGSALLEVQTSGLGTGARTVTLTVNDGSTVLESARVRVTKGAETYVGSTNSSGVIAFGLDDGTWTVSISLAGYQFTATTLVISADTSHTYSMTANTPTISTVGVTGVLIAYDDDYEPASGVVFYLIADDPRDSVGSGLPDGARTITSGTAGITSFTNLLPGIAYTIQRGTSGKKWPVEIPADVDTSVDYSLPSVIGTP